MNKSLKNILQRTINNAKSNWHIMLYPVLWAYRMLVKASIGFTPFQLVYGLESIFAMESEISSNKVVVELILDTFSLEEFLIHLEHLND